ncbi:MAG: ABC transporter substrate-binding protein [Deltaproteobacteria bacterium]|nr:ABC transporter substrate-binding protein [Deltaproteobacteria bacterium]MBM4299177.1 ABC transporter substrate-binding protein [Deltaproteobacteria bacterium]
MKTIKQICLALTLAGMLPGLASAQKITIAVSNPDMSFLSGGVAKFKGFFKEEGLDAELVQITANVSIAALAGGNIDYNLILQSVVTANLRGLPVKVAGILIDRPNHVIMTHPKITRFADLKGRKIAISSFGSATDILARLTVEHFKLNPSKDVQFVAAGSSSGRLTQLESGLVDAAVVSPPADLHAQARGFKSLVRTSDVLLFPVNGLGLHEQRLKNNRGEVKRVLRALLKANRYIIEDKKGAIDVLQKWSRTSQSTAEQSYASTVGNFARNLLAPRDALEKVIESTKLNIDLKRDVPLNDVFDLSLVREILKEMGETPKD